MKSSHCPFAAALKRKTLLRNSGFNLFCHISPPMKNGLAIKATLATLIQSRLLMKYGSTMSNSPAISGTKRTAFLPYMNMPRPTVL
jgi:hypothetical protein